VKKFYTERDIEDMAAAGATEIQIDDSVVLTDVARDKARKLGLHMKEASNVRKTFYTEDDIEDMAAAGATEIQIDDSVVLTDVARDKARKLGLCIREVAGGHVSEPDGRSLREASSNDKEIPEGGIPYQKSVPSDPVSEKAGDLETELLSVAERVSESSSIPEKEKIKALNPEKLERIRAALKELLLLIL